MIRALGLISLVLFPCISAADVVVPTRTIRADAIISPADVTMRSGLDQDGYHFVEDVIGQEARTTLYAGRVIALDAVGPPALVTRNQIVLVKFVSAGLTITTEGRSLERGGIGDKIRIMNLDSRTTLFGRIEEDGSIRVFK